MTTNVRRFAMLAAFAVATVFLARTGLPTSRAFFAMFGVWAVAVGGFHVLLRNARFWRAADDLQMLAFITDITFF